MQLKVGYNVYNDTYSSTSFSIENLSMCSGKMVLKGDPTKGEARWECQK